MAKPSVTTQWYVYELVDPRNDKVFYVGKGCGNRMYQHGKTDSSNFKKQQKIKAIGYDNVIRRKVAEFWCEKSALLHERERILSYSGLTNICMPVTTGSNRTVKPKMVSLLGLFYRFIMSSKQDERIEIAKKMFINYPYRLVNMPFADEYNMILDTPEKYLESIGCRIEYA